MSIKARYLGLTTVPEKKIKKFGVEVKDTSNHKIIFYFEDVVTASLYEKWINIKNFRSPLSVHKSKLIKVMEALKIVIVQYPEILSVNRHSRYSPQQLREVKI